MKGKIIEGERNLREATYWCGVISGANIRFCSSEKGCSGQGKFKGVKGIITAKGRVQWDHIRVKEVLYGEEYY